MAGTTELRRGHADGHAVTRGRAGAATVYTATRVGVRSRRERPRRAGDAGRSPRSTPAGCDARPRIWDTAGHARRPPAANDTGAIELGMRFRADCDGARHRACASTRARATRGTHVGHLWRGRRHAAGRGDVHRRDATRLAAGRRWPRRCRSPQGRPTSSRTTRQRPLRGRPRAAFDRGASTGRRCTPCARAWTGPTVCTATAPARFPDSTLQRHELLGGRRLRCRRRRPAVVVDHRAGGRRHRRGRRMPGPTRRSASRSARPASPSRCRRRRRRRRRRGRRRTTPTPAR